MSFSPAKFPGDDGPRRRGSLDPTLKSLTRWIRSSSSWIWFTRARPFKDFPGTTRRWSGVISSKDRDLVDDGLPVFWFCCSNSTWHRVRLTGLGRIRPLETVETLGLDEVELEELVFSPLPKSWSFQGMLDEFPDAIPELPPEARSPQLSYSGSVGINPESRFLSRIK